jgi:hypothetical protein
MRNSLVLFLAALLTWLHVVVVIEGFLSTAHTSRTTVIHLGLRATDQEQSHDESSSSSPPDFHINFTGIERVLRWKPAGRPIPLRSEIALLKSGLLFRRGEFSRLEGERVETFREKCEELGMTLPQGLLIRKQLMVSKVVANNWRLDLQFDTIHRKFCNREQSLLELSWDMDLPPVSILRTVLKNRVQEAYPDRRERDHKRLVQSIISEEDEERVHEFLTEWEIDQLQTAKLSDVVGYSKEKTETGSSIWEQALYSYLEENKINYITEDSMREAGARTTPDCLLLDDCIINGHRVRWIDSKSYFASGLKESWHYVRQLKRQIAKYEREFGESGAVIFKHGVSQKLDRTLPSTLFLDAGPLF